MSWFTDFFWPAGALSDLQRDLAALRLIADSNTVTLTGIKRELKTMSENEAAALAKLTDDLNKVAAGWAEKDALIAALRADLAASQAALATADADKAAAVADALTADSATDTAAIDAADAIVAGLVAPPAEPTPEG